MTRPRTPDLEVVVLDRVECGDDLVVLELGAVEGTRLPPWSPGSHIDVLLPSGLVRQYSLLGDPMRDTWRIAVLREERSRGGSAWMHRLQPGARLGLAGPRNHFEFEPGSGPVVFVAGGVGITPISAMAAAALREGREHVLHYAGRPGRMPLVDELRERHGDRLRLHRSGIDDRLDLDAVVAAADPRAMLYVCGPTALIDAATTAATAAGLEVRAERFEPTALTPPVRTEPFEVELALSGITVEVPPERSVLEVIEEQGVLVLSSCTEGTCGTCETPVLEGEVDHRDSILTPRERARNDVMFVCVSRAACPRLVLEL